MSWLKKLICKCPEQVKQPQIVCPHDIGNTEGSAFEIGNNIYRLQDNAMTLVPDGVYTHEGKYAVIDNEVLIYFK